jgi:two-component system LytT family response regulator
MLHSIIIDDESSGLKSLELLIKEFCPDLKVVATSTDSVAGVDLINDYRPDIVFLDINMPDLNGFDVLKKLEYRNFHLIFTTAHQEYALQAIKQNAIDYLLKPIDLDDLNKAIEKVKGRIKQNEKMPDILSLLKELNEANHSKITVPTKTAIELVSPDEIMYIEASSNSSVVTFTNGKQVSSSKSLKDFESNLCKEDIGFIRIHNSFIINVQCVSKYLKEDGGYVVINKKNIPVSKQKKDEFLKRINLKSE